MSEYTAWSDRRLTILPHNDLFDLANVIGQRESTFSFQLINGVTEEHLGYLQPMTGDAAATLTHDTTSTTKRQLTLSLDATDLAEINTLTDRVLPAMVIAGTSWPLGRYMFVTDPQYVRSGGNDGTPTLVDEMNLIDQQIDDAFAAVGSCDNAMLLALANLPLIDVRIEQSPFEAVGSWPIGARRGQILDAIAEIGDLESPWLDNLGVFRSIRVVDPAEAVPDFNFDAGTPAYMDSIMRSSNLLAAPNRFIVVGNGPKSAAAAVVGQYDIPATAPHSIANRGFVISQVQNLQVVTSAQATVAARTIALRSQPIEEITVTTPPDPRHDSYQVIRYLGSNWLEIGWSMTLIEGGDMVHTMRRALTA